MDVAVKKMKVNPEKTKVNYGRLRAKAKAKRPVLTADHLEIAKIILTPRRWGRGDNYDHNTGRVCLKGAISMALNPWLEPRVGAEVDSYLQNEDELEKYLADYLDSDYTLEGFNDDVAESVKDVHDFLDRAIAGMRA